MSNHNHHMMSTMGPTSDGHENHGTSKDHHSQMFFHTGYTEIILFKDIQLSSVPGLIGACLVVLVISTLYEGVKTLREEMLHKYGPAPVSQTKSTVKEEPESKASRRTKYSLCFHALQSVLHIIQVTLSYFLMLIFMTYNVWLCIAVGLGAGVGYFLFRWRRLWVVDINDHCN